MRELIITGGSVSRRLERMGLCLNRKKTGAHVGETLASQREAALKISPIERERICS